jgi:GNAT superfamily N-acetyltransferase
MSDYHRDGYTISTAAERLDLEAIYAALSRTYWAQNRPKEVVARSLQHSLCFGLYHDRQQIGLARVVTDYATFGYLADVYVREEYRGQGLGKWLIGVVMAEPALQGLRRWLLATSDAHGLYAQSGFAPLSAPERWMEQFNPAI